MKKLIIIQTAAPDYRKNFFDSLATELKNQFELFSGNEYFEPSVKTDKNINFHPLKNHFLLNRNFLFQTGLWHLLFSNSVIVMEMNPRIINNWIFLIIRKILNKKSILWGHAWPRGGKNSKSDFLRHLMRKLADEIIVYTKKQQKELKEKMPNKEIKAAPNALYYKDMMEPVKINNKRNLIYVGRLTPKKKVFFLVKAFKKALNLIPENANLLIVGDGEEYDKINNYIHNNNLQNRIKLFGHISNYQKLKELYSESFFSVSPGYVGLSVTQSFGFGIPILVSANENHSPEIEAVIDGENAVFFETDQIDDFLKKLSEIYKKQDFWIEKRKDIVDFCKKNYSTENMVKPFKHLLEK